MLFCDTLDREDRKLRVDSHLRRSDGVAIFLTYTTAGQENLSERNPTLKQTIFCPSGYPELNSLHALSEGRRIKPTSPQAKLKNQDDPQSFVGADLTT